MNSQPGSVAVQAILYRFSIILYLFYLPYSPSRCQGQEHRYGIAVLTTLAVLAILTGLKYYEHVILRAWVDPRGLDNSEGLALAIFILCFGF
jgi:hypothetical protein